ncbi:MULTISPECIES: hypothetical protein [Niastella]|uniref:Uncharacterized protein n=1 Tax=Niastella soli TaxID=2821487 RepID=A0ABS3YTQ9_9BACT|nr:hypothetical protein [Niastella soli]MBO9200815.1 hypothetical protein [Niastella soli]
MKKILLTLSGVCNWLIFFELLFAVWSLFGIFSMINGGYTDWQIWASFAIYSTLLYLFVTLKNKIVFFRDNDEESLLEVDPTAIVPNGFSTLLLGLFSIHMLWALYLGIRGLDALLYSFISFSFRGYMLLTILTFFILPLGVVINGVRLYILILKFYRLKKPIRMIDNA